MVSDKGEAQISTTMRVLPEVIASDAAWLLAINRAIDGVMESNQKARATLGRSIRSTATNAGSSNSLTANLQRFGFEKASKVETLNDGKSLDFQAFLSSYDRVRRLLPAPEVSWSVF